MAAARQSNKHRVARQFTHTLNTYGGLETISKLTDKGRYLKHWSLERLNGSIGGLFEMGNTHHPATLFRYSSFPFPPQHPSSRPHSFAPPSDLPYALPAALAHALPSDLPYALPASLAHALLSDLPYALPAALAHALLPDLPYALPAALAHALLSDPQHDNALRTADH